MVLCRGALTRLLRHALDAARLATTHIESEYKVATLSDMRIGVASYGALGHVPPPRLPASYFERTRTNFKRTNTENYKNNAIFAQFLSFFGPFFVIYLPTVFVRE